MSSNRVPTVSGFHPRLEQVVQDSNFAAATLDQYVLLVWRKQITIEGAQAVSGAMSRLHIARAKQKLGFITLIEDGCSLGTSAEVRNVMSAMLKTHNNVLGAAAIAYEREGFWSAMARSVITAINVASRAAFPSDVSSDVHDAITFVTNELKDSSETRWQTLRAALDSLRGEAINLQRWG